MVLASLDTNVQLKSNNKNWSILRTSLLKRITKSWSATCKHMTQWLVKNSTLSLLRWLHSQSSLLASLLDFALVVAFLVLQSDSEVLRTQKQLEVHLKWTVSSRICKSVIIKTTQKLWTNLKGKTNSFPVTDSTVRGLIDPSMLFQKSTMRSWL